MNFLRKRWRMFLWLGIFAVVISCGVALWSGWEIASPARRKLMDYHREILDHPRRYGLSVKRFSASDGTPCLVCEPDGTPGSRGATLRKQLSERGLALSPFGKITGTLVLVHGRTGRKEDFLSIAERLCAAGFRCIMPDMPAHGDHPVSVATYGIREAGIPNRVLEEAAQRFHFEKSPAGLMGISMGGSVVMHAADLPGAPWKAVVVVSSFDELSAVINSQATRLAGVAIGPVWAATSAMIYQKKTGIPLAEIRPAAHAAALHMPVLIAHGTNDRQVPIDCGRRLFAALPASTTKRWVEIPGADHNNVLITNYPIYADIAEWMMRYVCENNVSASKLTL